MLSFLFPRAANRRIVDRLYGEIVAVARNPVLFRDYAAPDTFEGRFETLTLAAHLVLRRLAALPPPASELAQELVDSIFSHLDATLREMGVGDPSVPKRMKKLAEAFYGRGFAYQQAAREGLPALEQALRRNVYAGRADAARLARYAQAVAAALETASFETFVRGPLPFPDPADVI